MMSTTWPNVVLSIKTGNKNRQIGVFFSNLFVPKGSNTTFMHINNAQRWIYVFHMWLTS